MEDDALFEPMADALREIAKIVDRSESDPDEMLRMLHQIQDQVDAGKQSYMTAISLAQQAELQRLRAKAK